MMQRALARKPAESSAAPLRAPSALRINEPGDTFEREADRVADAVVSGGRIPSWSIGRIGIGAVQRDTPDTTGEQQPKPDNYAEAGQKVLEAAMQTDAGKKVVERVEKDPLVKDVKDFVATTPGMIVTGAAAAGAVAGLAAGHKPLPAQLPTVPVDKVIPALKGVKAQITVQGPIDRPTQITIGFSGTFGGGSDKKKKDDPSARIKSETAALQQSLDMFKPKGQGASDDVGELLKLGKGAATPGFSIEDFGRRSPAPLPGTQGAPLTLAQHPGDAPLDQQGKKEDEIPIQRKPDGVGPVLQRKCSCGGSGEMGGECEECGKKKLLQRKSSDSFSASAPSSVENALRTSGSPLDVETRTFFERRFGMDFSKVRIHTGAQEASSAADVAARAYTVGESIVFNSGQYSPHTQEGRKLLAHELTHVVRQTGAHANTAAAPRAVQRKVILKHAEMKDKERHDFLVARKHDWGRNQHRASQIMAEMAAAGDSFDFLDEDELKTEIVKRISTVQHMEESQLPQGKVPAHLQTAFGYPFNPPADVYGPRVNFAAKDYWEPGVPDNYGLRTDPAKIKAARKLSRSDRHTVFGDQPMGTYFWKLTDKGKADPLTAIKKLFVPQSPHKRTLFHCDYLISVVNFMSLADSLGKAEFNHRIAVFGVDKILLNWNAFTDLHADTALRDPKGEFTSKAAHGLGSTQRVQPSTEKDLVIGDHVVFFNHLAYDLLNERQGHAWRLENAVFVSRRGHENVYLGHGSGYLTDSEMRGKLATAFNNVVAIAKPLIAKSKSHDTKTAAAGEHDLNKEFPKIDHVGHEFHVMGKDGQNCNKDIDFNVDNITKDKVIGLHNPCNPSEMYQVERPIESKP